MPNSDVACKAAAALCQWLRVTLAGNVEEPWAALVMGHNKDWLVPTAKTLKISEIKWSGNHWSRFLSKIGAKDAQWNYQTARYGRKKKKKLRPQPQCYFCKRGKASLEDAADLSSMKGLQPQNPPSFIGPLLNTVVHTQPLQKAC